MSRKKKKKSPKRRGKTLTSAEWNEENPDRVQAARVRYAKKRKKDRKAMSPYERAQDDVNRLLKRHKLTEQQRKNLLRAALKKKA